jgi:hypothetical protein
MVKYAARMLAVGALVATGLMMTASPALATVDPPGGGVCTYSSIRVSPSYNDPNIRVAVSNDGDCGIRVYVHCTHDLLDTGFGTFYKYGSIAGNGQTSSTSCGVDDYYGTSGWEWFDGSTWHKVGFYTV